MDLRHKKIWVTGGRGFLGSHVVDKLAQRSAKVLAPSRQEVDLLDRAAVERFLARSRPELVIHAAAYIGGIGENRRHPARLCYENLVMNTQLLEACRLHGVEKFVGIGSVCSYPKIVPVPFREDDLWNGYPEETNAPYGLAKKMLLVQSQAYRQEYGFNAIHLLMVNMYGPRDKFDPRWSHVIPALIRKCVEAKESGRDHIKVWGDGSPTREFLYVEDAAEAIVLAAERYDKPEPVNVGSGVEVSIRDLADMIGSKLGFRGRIEWDRRQPNGQPRRRLDTSRAAREFGFRARVGLDEGLDRTIQWFLQNREYITR